MSDLLTTLHPINDNNTDLYPNVKNENLPPVISGKDAMEALEGDFDTLKTDEIQVGGENGTLINKDQIVTQSKVINLNEIVDDAELAQALNGKVDKEQGKGLSTNDFTNADKALVGTIPDKVDKVQGKGLSTNDFTNANKTALEVTIPDELTSLRAHILNLYRMVIRSGDMITVTDASVALASQPFPSTVSPKALLNYIGGMCQKIGDSIVTAPVTMMISKSFNQWDEEWEVGRYNTTTGEKIAGDNNNIRNKNPISVLPNSTCYFKATAVMTVVCYDSDDNVIGVLYAQNETKALPVGCSYINFFTPSAYGTTYNHDICINRSNASMNGTYLPYRGNIYYPIHPEIMALDGYGWGIDGDCYNYIDFERKVFVKKVARIDLGSLDWTSQTKGFFVSLLSAKKPSTNQTVAKLLCKAFTATYANGWNGREDDKIMALSTAGNFNARDDRYSTISDFKTAMSGVYLYYELATPVETDISDLLKYNFPTYDIIYVIAGGYLEFENENDIGVPYSVTYQSKPNAQATALTTALTTAQPAISEVDSNDPTDTI